MVPPALICPGEIIGLEEDFVHWIWLDANETEIIAKARNVSARFRIIQPPITKYERGERWWWKEMPPKGSSN
jgi:hypothetical protein